MPPKQVPQFTGTGLDDVLRQMPAAVVVVDARSRAIVYSNTRARQMTERQIGRPIPPDLTDDWEIFHPDGRPYRMDEWPLVRSITTGEEVVDEEYFSVAADGRRLVVRCSSSAVYGQDRRIVAGVLIMTDITEERHAEDQLAYHASLPDIVDDAVVGTDAEFRLTVWNAGAERLYGYTAGEVLGRDARDVASYAGDTSRRELESELLERDRVRTELTAYRQDGTAVEVELISAAVRGDRGEITGYLGIHRDVTERRRAEELLRGSHRQIEAILESVTDAFIALDREWRYTYVNDLALSRLAVWQGREVTRQEILGRTMWEVFPDMVGTEVEDRLMEASRGDHPVEFELYFPPTDEWIEARAYPWPAGLSISYRNVSERRRAIADLGRSARRHAVVAELGLRALASEDPEWLMDEAATVCARMLEVDLVGIHELRAGGGELVLRAGVGWRNGAVGNAASFAGDRSLMGYTLTAGQPVISDDVAADARFAVSPLLADHGTAAAVCVVIEGRGQQFGVLGVFAARPRTFSAMDVDFVQAIANVIAAAVERWKAEERLIQVRELERRRIARDLHDEALQDLSETLARAATATAGSGEADDRFASVVPALKRIGLHLRGAIYDLRLGGEETRPFPELLEGLLDVQRALAEGSLIQLDIGAGTPAGPLGRQGTEVLRIIGEAVVNARRHAHARQIVVDVSGVAGRLFVVVSDDGRGFDMQRSEAMAGTGIDGMRERAALLGGDLDVTSRPGAGTRIRFELPLTSAPHESEHEFRILLVEDHAVVREAVAAMFEREPDLTVVGQAPSLAEARTMLGDVDVAVLDVGLPDGDGTDLIAELRQASPQAQALVLSASLDRAQTARAIERGAAATLDKTAHLDEIVDVVRRLRAGKTVLALHEVVELLAFAGRQREQELADRRAIERLTPREREVLHALGEGLDSQAIAMRLDISIRTQRNHVAGILTKLGVHSQLQAVLFALRYGVIELP